MQVNRNARPTNRTILELYRDLKSGKLIAQPAFQRELVWNNRHCIDFLETIIQGYPFPEIYLAMGEVNVDEATTTELVVDGLQRLSTIKRYIDGDTTLKVGNRIPAYQDLTSDQKKAFLSYEVVVRHLGAISDDEIREVFRRINSTEYALNAIEMHKAYYGGPLFQLAKALSDHQCFEGVFSSSEARRMRDVEYVLTVICTFLEGTYFHQDEKLEEYLANFNDDFPGEEAMLDRVKTILDFVVALDLPTKSRWRQKADLFTLIVELGFLAEATPLHKIDSLKLKDRLASLEQDINRARNNEPVEHVVREYYDAVASGTAKRSSRITRGQVIQDLLSKCVSK